MKLKTRYSQEYVRNRRLRRQRYRVLRAFVGASHWPMEERPLPPTGRQQTKSERSVPLLEVLITLCVILTVAAPLASVLARFSGAGLQDAAFWGLLLSIGALIAGLLFLIVFIGARRYERS